LLTREQILGAADLKKERVEVPEWGGEVYVRTMTGAEREAFEVRAVDTKAKVIPTLLALTLCDAEGSLIFTPDDIDAINGKSVAALMRLQAVAVRINRIEAEAVDRAEGESDATRSNTTPSGSPNDSA
jgi:hypothetical protein